MTDARIKARQLAAEKYRIIAVDGVPSGYAVRNAFTAGYLAARTITAEELEAAARAVHGATNVGPWDESPSLHTRKMFDSARAAFKAVGLQVKEWE